MNAAKPFDTAPHKVSMAIDFADYMSIYSMFCKEHGIELYEICIDFGEESKLSFGFDTTDQALMFKLVHG